MQAGTGVQDVHRLREAESFRLVTFYYVFSIQLHSKKLHSKERSMTEAFSTDGTRPGIHSRSRKQPKLNPALPTELHFQVQST